MALDFRDESGIDAWICRILDQEGNLVRQYEGAGAPEKPVLWDGKSEQGESLETVGEYVLAITVADGLGNAATRRYRMTMKE